MLLAACAATEPVVPTQPTSVLEPTRVGGLPVTDGPSGLRPSAEPADLPVVGGAGTRMDRIATNAVADVQRYWRGVFRNRFEADFSGVSKLVSFDAQQGGRTVCDFDTAGFTNALYCSKGDFVAWDRGVLLPNLAETYGPLSVVLVIAHELGHMVAPQRGLNPQRTPTVVREQRADCFAGAFFRHVAQGESQHFRMSTGPGLNRVLAALIEIRDPTGVTGSATAHGNAIDRITAFGLGFRLGPVRCTTMDIAGVAQRLTTRQFRSLDALLSGGDLRIERETIELATPSLRAALGDTRRPGATVEYGEADDCADAEATPPASYCPATRTVTLDLDGLREIAQRGSGLATQAYGDFSALAEFGSRYALAVQQATGGRLRGYAAGLQSACLVGGWAAFISEPRRRLQLSLSPGDLDEAVVELLNTGQIASDVDGTDVPSGLARVRALRLGYDLGTDYCARIG